MSQDAPWKSTYSPSVFPGEYFLLFSALERGRGGEGGGVEAGGGGGVWVDRVAVETHGNDVLASFLLLQHAFALSIISFLFLRRTETLGMMTRGKKAQIYRKVKWVWG